MADKKTEAELEMEDDAGPEEDTRDIFDKALDWAPYVGGLVGTIAGLRWNIKRMRSIDKRSKAAHKRWDQLRAKNQIRGLTPEEGIKMYQAEKEMARIDTELGADLGQRILFNAPIGITLGNTAGGFARDTLQKKPKPPGKRKK
jgi:hypothetical protein